MSTPVLRVQLDVIAQELTYMGSAKPIPETYWKDTLVPLLYPDWDSEKDKLITFSYYSDSNKYIAARRKFVRNFTTNTDEWKDYEMEAVDNAKATTLKDKLIEGWYLIDSIENKDVETVLAIIKTIDRQKQILCIPHPFIEDLDTFPVKSMRQGMCNFIFFKDENNQNQY